MCLIWVMISLVKAQIALKLFNDLALYTETYMNFTEMQIVFFNSIEGKLEDMGLAGGTFVDEHFVENQLEQGIKTVVVLLTNNSGSFPEYLLVLATLFI